METILLLIATALAFGLFFLVFFLKDTAKDQPARFHNCGSCKCQRSEQRADIFDVKTPADKNKPCRSDPAHVS